MKELVAAVSETYPDRRIIVRPHPSENHASWEAVTAGLDNVDVIYEGTVIPWLIAADVMIHNGCTTAIESFFLETPAIAFRPVVKQGYEFELPNEVSIQARTQRDVVEAIDLAVRRGDDYYAWRRQAGKQLQFYVEDVNEAPACDRIIDELESYYSRFPLTPEPWRRRALRKLKHRVKEAGRTLKHGLSSEQRRNLLPVGMHRRQKFPGISMEEVESLIVEFRKVSGRFEEVRTSRIPGARKSFLIHGRKR